MGQGCHVTQVTMLIESHSASESENRDQNQLLQYHLHPNRCTAPCPALALTWFVFHFKPLGCCHVSNLAQNSAEPLAGDLTPLFDLSSEGFPWRAPRPHEIETRRAQLSDLLIFDILLSSGGIRHPDTLWPPTDPASLRRLLDAIDDSTYDALKKDCLIYFLLKWHQDGREERFREDRCIPPQFAMLSDAYWHLDSGIHVEVRSMLSYPVFWASKPVLFGEPEGYISTM